jgi:hypothetical protein
MSNYRLWLNGAGSSGAVVELTPTNVSRVVSGDREFAQGVADTLGLPLTVESWSVATFRSSYYSEYPDSDDWEDRFPEFWRLTLTGSPAGDGNASPALSPVPYEGYDSTWNPVDEPPVTSSTPYLAIGTRLGDQPDDELLDRIRALRPGAPVETIAGRDGDLTGTRVVLDLGAVDLTEQRDEVDGLDRRLGELGLVTGWPALKRRMIQLGP